jgi:hypothetical protein
MKRREFITMLAGAAAWPLAARAQQGERMRRIEVLLPVATDDAEFQTRVGAFLQALQQLDWTIGRNVEVDIRWATANADAIRCVVAERDSRRNPRPQDRFRMKLPLRSRGTRNLDLAILGQDRLRTCPVAAIAAPAAGRGNLWHISSISAACAALA